MYAGGTADDFSKIYGKLGFFIWCQRIFEFKKKSNVSEAVEIRYVEVWFRLGVVGGFESCILIYFH